MRTLSQVAAGLLAMVVLSSLAGAGDWPRFRGPDGAGIASDDVPTPTEWSPTENLKWKIELPGPGVSSPIVVGDRIFVTCYSGYGGSLGDNIENLKRHLLCVDRAAGSVVWQKTIDAVQPEDAWTPPGIPAHGYASHTPASDGKRVYAFFGKTGVIAFDLDGNQLWQTTVGTGSDPRAWGSSSSPVVVDNLVVVAAGPEDRALVGLNAETGEQVWKSEGDGLGNTWGTPSIARLEDGSSEIVLGTPYEIWGLNPENGKLRWYCEAGESDQFSSSVVVTGNVAYAVEGRGGATLAMKVGGRGDVSSSNVLWTGNSSGRFGSPIIAEGRLYYFGGGVANCLDAATGETIFQGRLRGAGAGAGAPPGAGRGGPGPGAGRSEGRPEGQDRPGGRPGAGGPPGGGPPGGGRGGRGGGFGGGDYASPVMADGKIYFLARSGLTHVIRASAEFEQLAANTVTTDEESFGGTPAISNGELFIRSDKHLYCISQQ